MLYRQIIIYQIFEVYFVSKIFCHWCRSVPIVIYLNHNGFLSSVSWRWKGNTYICLILSQSKQERFAFSTHYNLHIWLLLIVWLVLWQLSADDDTNEGLFPCGHELQPISKVKVCIFDTIGYKDIIDGCRNMQHLQGCGKYTIYFYSVELVMSTRVQNH